MPVEEQTFFIFLLNPYLPRDFVFA